MHYHHHHTHHINGQDVLLGYALASAVQSNNCCCRRDPYEGVGLAIVLLIIFGGGGFMAHPALGIGLVVLGLLGYFIWMVCAAALEVWRWLCGLFVYTPQRERGEEPRMMHDGDYVMNGYRRRDGVWVTDPTAPDWRTTPPWQRWEPRLLP